jgi:protein-S-isoprenylcysteine O-methyltransferase Ste14
MQWELVVIGFGWVAFWIYWAAASFTAKASRRGWRRQAGARIALIVIAVYLVRVNFRGGGGRPRLGHDPLLEGIGLALWIAGLGLAVWARLYIGRNWGMPMSQREDPDLVTTGPYRSIRHPIYSGIILAMIGTALATTLYGLIVVAILLGFFTFSAVQEERFLAGEFPATFPAYKARTKMLIPFVL